MQATRQDPRTGSSLRPAVGRSGFFTLALGAVIGSGWVVVLGEWLRQAGPGGAVIGFLAGGLSMACIALCYGELASRFSRAGGEFLYTLETLGPFPGFLMGWFLTLFAVSVCAFEAVVVGTLLRALLSGIDFPVIYAIGGSQVTAESLGIGIVGALGIGALHLGGANLAIRFQNIVTYGFLVLMLGLVLAGLICGDSRNLEPLLAPEKQSGLPGWVWVFSTCTFFLNGWQTALHAIEERAAGVTVTAAVWSMVMGVLGAAALYSGLVIAVASAVPWSGLTTDEMPAKSAFSAIASPLGSLVLVAALVSASKTWSAVAWVASRLLVAQARIGFLPRNLAAVHPTSGAPYLAIAVVTSVTLLGPIFGKSTILPLVGMVSICLALSIILCLFVLLRLRRLGGELPQFTVPGGVATITLALVLALTMIGIALAEPLISRGTIPIEWYLLAGWGALGMATYGLMRRRDIARPAYNASRKRSIETSQFNGSSQR